MAVIRKNKTRKSAVIVADRNSIQPDLSDLKKFGLTMSSVSLKLIGFFMFKANSPTEFKDKTILAFSGSPDGTIPANSVKAYQEYGDDADMIFCCHPKTMRRSLDDDRVQWSTADGQLGVLMKEVGDSLIITIREENNG